MADGAPTGPPGASLAALPRRKTGARRTARPSRYGLGAGRNLLDRPVDQVAVAVPGDLVRLRDRVGDDPVVRRELADRVDRSRVPDERERLAAAAAEVQ